MSMNLVTILYLVASVCFIQALKGLSHPTTSIRGNLFGMVGMAIAAVTTVGLIWTQASALAKNPVEGLGWVVLGVLIGGTAGAVMAKRVEMTKMPELVAFMHSMIGLAAVFIAVAAAVEPWAFGIVAKGSAIPYGNRLELALGAAIGAITFSGSVIAFGKLSGKYKFRLFQGAPVQFAGQHKLNLVLGLATLFFIVGYTLSESRVDFWLLLALAFVMGVLIIIPIGGADMPVGGVHAQQLLGLGCGRHRFQPEQLDADHCRQPGGLVRRDPELHHVQGDEPLVLQRDPGRFRWRGDHRRGRCGAAQCQERQCRRRGLRAEQCRNRGDRAGLWPGRGPGAACREGTGRQAHRKGHHGQICDPSGGRPHARSHERAAGRAEVPYDQVFEMEDINGEFGQADVAIILGANDVVNPAAHVKGSAIYGMPILEAYKAKTVIVNKRSMAAGYAGLDNELFYMDKTMMVFGDAKKVVEDMGKAIE